LTFTHQEIADARAIRNKILTNFELATQLKTSDKERERLLHFVIVGGGPTGVEFGGEFYDFLMQVGHMYLLKRLQWILYFSC